MNVQTVGVLAIAEAHTTARYFERAVEAQGRRLLRLSTLDGITLAALANLEMLIVVDPWMTELPRLRDVPCPTAAVLIDVHCELRRRLIFGRYVDHAFVAQRDYVSVFAADGHPNSWWLPLGCDPEIHHVPNLERDFDVGFVGKLGAPGSERHSVLTSVLTRFKTNDYNAYHSPAEMGETYSRSKIVLNKSIAGDLNMRVFEAMASGALLITDKIENGLDWVGTNREHFVCYENSAQAVDAVKYYLGNDDERKRIAKLGQQRVLQQHSYSRRLEEIIGKVKAGPGSTAPVRDAAPRVEMLWRSEWLRICGASPGAAISFLKSGIPSVPMLINIVIGLLRRGSQNVKAKRSRSGDHSSQTK